MKTVEEIQREYGIECAKLGDMVYRSEKLSEDIEKLKLKLFNINVEAEKLDKKMKDSASGSGSDEPA